MVAALNCFIVSALPPKNFFMSFTPTRLVIFPQDVKDLLLCSSSTASRKLREIRDANGKPAHQEVSIEEYCNYYGLNYKEVCEFLKLIK